MLNIGGFSNPMKILYFLHVDGIVNNTLSKEWSNIVVLERKEYLMKLVTTKMRVDN